MNNMYFQTIKLTYLTADFTIELDIIVGLDEHHVLKVLRKDRGEPAVREVPGQGEHPLTWHRCRGTREDVLGQQWNVGQIVLRALLNVTISENK